MKKVLPVLVLGGLLAGLLVPIVSLAQVGGPQDCCTLRQNIIVEGRTFPEGQVVGALADQNPVCDEPIANATANWGIVCMLNTIYSATNWFFYILIIVSVIMIIWGGFSILFATGDPDKMKKGRGVIIYAIVGVAIALFAKVIPSIVRFIMAV